MDAQMAIGGIVYGLWLTLPIVATVFLIRKPALRSSFHLNPVVPVVIAIPAYVSLPCVLAGWMWPPDLFLPPGHSPLVAYVANYQIEFAQRWGRSFYETYFEVTRADGLKAFLEIDGDSRKCWTMTKQQVGAKVYFLCNETTVTGNTAYVDMRESLLYTGRTRCSRRLDQLRFGRYDDNPLLNGSATSTEFYCNANSGNSPVTGP
jgi:hypothetical protein